MFAFISRIDRKKMLVLVGVVLLLLNVARLARNYYIDQKEEVKSRINLLDQYKQAAARLPGLKKRVKQLERKNKQFDKFYFSGSSEEEISSAMQIELQKKVSSAGLEPESIRPIRRGRKSGSSEEIMIKLRLNGNLDQFLDFLADLYGSKKYFKMESFTIKPAKADKLKIFLEFKGFYHLEQKN
jgi:Tfp pilus assembly protein PilO